MARSHALENLRDTLLETAVSAPVSGELYIETNSRLRRWVMDVAGSMNSIYLAVNQHDMDLGEDAIPSAIGAGLSVLTNGVSFEGLDKVQRHVASLNLLLKDAVDAEDVSQYSPVFAASRAAVQAVSSALQMTGDHDIFSVAARAGVVVEQCVLANAYLELSKDFDGTVAPSHKQVADAIAEARAEMVPLYKEGLLSRLKENVPGDFERPVALAPTI
jgi:hypothetical protein